MGVKLLTGKWLGSNGLPEEASQFIQLNWLKPENKQDQRIAITTEGRNLKPIDMVVEQVQRSQWISHGSSADIKEELRLEKEERRLNEKQDLVYTFVNQLEKPNPIDALRISREFADIYLDKNGKNTNGNIKAFATLNQLANKGLIKKKIFATVERGNVAVFFPRSWQDSEVSTLLFR
jgi:Txe/YoeB family toxin of Txe-Axe toxin-antitoxin module